jgi:hypothetical protein
MKKLKPEDTQANSGSQDPAPQSTQNTGEAVDPVSPPPVTEPAPVSENRTPPVRDKTPLVVYYRVSKQVADEINARRNVAMADCRSKTSNRNVKPSVHGNDVNEGNVFPAMVVAAWSSNCVNLQVILDGNDSHWVTSANEGDQVGQWFRP